MNLSQNSLNNNSECNAMLDNAHKLKAHTFKRKLSLFDIRYATIINKVITVRVITQFLDSININRGFHSNNANIILFVCLKFICPYKILLLYLCIVYLM